MPPQRKRVHPHVQNQIQQLALEGFTPTQIERTLQAKRQLLEKWGTNVPSLRTVQRVVREMSPKETSRPWTLDESDGLEPDTLRAVLDVQRTVIERTRGRRISLTVAEVGWIARLHSAAPELDSWDLFWYTSLYLGRGKGQTVDLDSLVAFRPWRDEEAAKRYQVALDEAWVPPAPRPGPAEGPTQRVRVTQPAPTVTGGRGNQNPKRRRRPRN
jgi:hypothetical protein